MTALLQAEGLRVRMGTTMALDGVSLALHPGEALGLVGESGCGKSTLLRVLLRLLAPDAGRLCLAGTDITTARGRALAPLRDTVQMVFQNPAAAMSPRGRVASIVTEPLRIRGGLSRAQLRCRAVALLEDVGLGAAFLNRRPHELSGGQKQRVCIARALAPAPRALMLDEPTSALDVSVQAQILALLRDLRARHGLSLLLVSHDLAVVRLLCPLVAVMRAGRIVEQGQASQVFNAPQHPYTRALLASWLAPAAQL